MKKNIMIFFIGCIYLSCYPQSEFYKQYTDTYEIDEYEIKKILGVYVKKNEDGGNNIWFEYKNEHWGDGYSAYYGVSSIQEMNFLQNHTQLNRFLFFYDDGIIFKIDSLIKLDDKKYRLLVSLVTITDLKNKKVSMENQGYIDLDFVTEVDIIICYNVKIINKGYLFSSYFYKTSGPLIKHKPLAGNYVVAASPYAKDGRVYDSLEALNKGEKEYALKLKQKKN